MLLKLCIISSLVISVSASVPVSCSISSATLAVERRSSAVSPSNSIATLMSSSDTSNSSLIASLISSHTSFTVSVTSLLSALELTSDILDVSAFLAEPVTLLLSSDVLFFADILLVLVF